MPEAGGFWDRIRRWRGVILIFTISVATLWFSASGKLLYYVHPRYLIFTSVMAGIALLFCAARVAVAVREARHPGAPPDDHDEHEDDDPPPTGRAGRLLSTIALSVAALVAVAMIALPPATLSSATALQRDVSDSSVAAGAASLSSAQNASNAASAKYTVLEWSSLLQQTDQLSFYAGKPVDVTGFVTPDPSDPVNVFYLTRFVITCCAVDAQPVGVPVYSPNWKSSYPANSWVRVTGGFAADHSATSTAEIAIAPTGVTRVGEPANPYLY